MASKKKPSPSFEQSLSELENIIETMEASDTTLESSLALFEKGVKLTKHCQQTLKKAELTVNQLIEDHQGNTTEQPFALDDDT